MFDGLGTPRDRLRAKQNHQAKKNSKKKHKNLSSGHKFNGPCCPKCEKEWLARNSFLQ